MNPADLIQRLREFAKATCKTVTAENGEQLTYEDSVIWLAADTLAANVKALAEIRAENERLRAGIADIELDIHLASGIEGYDLKPALAKIRSLGLLDGAAPDDVPEGR